MKLLAKSGRSRSAELVECWPGAQLSIPADVLPPLFSFAAQLARDHRASPLQ
jgi:hypothetical protein